MQKELEFLYEMLIAEAMFLSVLLFGFLADALVQLRRRLSKWGNS